MKTLILLIAVCLNSLAIYPRQILSQQKPTNSVITFQFINSESGYSIQPESFIIYDDVNRMTVMSVNQSEISKNGTISFELEKGQYKIYAASPGFFTFLSKMNTFDGTPRFNKVFMDPLNKCNELNYDRIKFLYKENSTVIFGFIVDDQTGEPVSDVLISLSNSNNRAYSNSRGYFEIYIPSASCDSNAYGKLKFELNKYLLTTFDYLELFPKDGTILNVRLKKGYGEIKIDQRQYRNRSNEPQKKSTDCLECDNELNNKITFNSIQSNNTNLPFLYDAVAIPATIRVGRNCVGTNCSTVEYYSLETYCKYVIPAEIYGCWGGLSGGMNSLQAIAVSVRSYGLWYIYNPLTSTYDICDNTYCQQFGSTQNSYCNTAVDNTARYILVSSNGLIVKSEYSAENNNMGCGNGYTGTGSTSPCIYDPVCINTTSNGHGRGLCQWGTIRWATGTKVLVATPCALGVNHGYGTKTWQQILTHYYPSYTLTQGGTANIVSSSPNPSSTSPCSTIVIQYSVSTTAQMSLMLAASIRKNGTTTWISDPAHDIKLQIPSGTSSQSRSFTIPCSAITGSYDILTALWFDKNNNNVIDATDLIMGTFQGNNVLTIQQFSGSASIQSGITISPNPVNLGSNFTSTFTLKETSGNSVTYDTITCAILKNDNTFCFDMQRNSNVTIPANSTWNYSSPGVLSLPNYQSGTYKAVARGKRNGSWSDFGTTGSGQNNIQFIAQYPTFQITCTSNPVSGGYTNGSGTYTYGQTANLLATSNSGYNFVNWTENGTPVSSNTNWSFTVTSPRTLVANFSPVSGINPVSGVIPTEYNLFQNYPNPFNPETKISFDIPKIQLVTIKIYDILGREVLLLFNSELNSGRYEIRYNASDLNSGIYYCYLYTKEYTSVKKMLLIK